jgi:hypothetical protein
VGTVCVSHSAHLHVNYSVPDSDTKPSVPKDIKPPCCALLPPGVGMQEHGMQSGAA